MQFWNKAVNIKQMNNFLQKPYKHFLYNLVQIILFLFLTCAYILVDSICIKFDIFNIIYKAIWQLSLLDLFLLITFYALSYFTTVNNSSAARLLIAYLQFHWMI